MPQFRYIISSLIVLIFAVYFISKHNELILKEVEGFCPKALAQAVTKGQIDFIDYDLFQNKIFGYIKPEAAALLAGGSFHCEPGLEYGLFNQIQSQSLSPYRFLGPLIHFQEESDLKKDLGVRESASIDPDNFSDEKLSYSLNVLGLKLLIVKTHIQKLVMFEKKLALEISIHLEFSKFLSQKIRASDNATFWQSPDFKTFFGSLFFINEKERFGVQSIKVDKDIATYKDHLVSKAHGETNTETMSAWSQGTQSPFSVLFFLRSIDWKTYETNSFSIGDSHKHIQLRALRVAENNDFWTIQVLPDKKPRFFPEIMIEIGKERPHLIQKMRARIGPLHTDLILEKDSG